MTIPEKTSHRKSLPIAIYAVLSILFSMILLGLMGVWSIDRVNEVEGTLKQEQQVLAEQELSDALIYIEHDLHEHIEKIGSWDEIFQQLHNPIYYDYWHKNRLSTSEHLTEYIKRVELYSKDGNGLRKISPGVLPAKIKNNKDGADIIKYQGTLYLRYTSKIKSDPNHDVLIGYVVLAVDLKDMLSTHYSFKYADIDSLVVNIKEQVSIPVKKLVNYVDIKILPDPGIIIYRDVIREVSLQFAIAIVGVMIFYWVLFVFIASQPLRRLMQSLQSLRAGDEDIERNPFILPIRELERVESSLNEYHYQLKDQTKELLRFRSALDNSPDHFFLIDSVSMRFLDMNEAAVKGLGYSREELINKMGPADIEPLYYDDLLEQQYSEILNSEYDSKSDSNGDGVIETIHRCKDGKDFPVEIYIHSMHVENQDVIVADARDITQRKQAERELRNARDDLERRVEERTAELANAKEEAVYANTAKSRFLSQMSHELRTPLNAISGFSQIMMMDGKKYLTDEHSKMVEEIYNASGHLLELINEVLDLSRIEAGRIDLDLKDIDLAEVVHECVMMVEPLVDGLDIQLTNMIHEEDNYFITADYFRCKQVIINLLSNAIKYNRKGGFVKVNCDFIGTDLVRIDVIDNGLGIMADKTESLFEPFMRLETDRSIEGTGIGLAVTKQLVELMGGKIGVESTPGEGSVFWFELPRALSIDKEKGKKIPTNVLPIQKEKFSNISILYIEDDMCNISVMEAFIDKFPGGAECVSSLIPEEGIKIAIENPPDLILLDISMPGMSGFEVLSELRSCEVTKNIPVVAVSANVLSEDIEKAIDAGFDDYITKPVDFEHLYNVIRNYVDSKKAIM